MKRVDGGRGYKYHDMRTVMGRINAEKEIDRLRAALEEIANEDYRGVEPTSRRIARKALGETAHANE